MSKRPAFPTSPFRDSKERWGWFKRECDEPFKDIYKLADGAARKKWEANRHHELEAARQKAYGEGYEEGLRQSWDNLFDTARKAMKP